MSTIANMGKSWMYFLPKHVSAAQEYAFDSLGQTIGGKPRITVILCLVLYAVCACGIGLLKGNGSVFFLKMETDFLKTFAFTNSVEYDEYMKATGIFPEVRSISLIATPVNGNSPLSSSTFRSVLETEQHIMLSLKASYGDRQYTYEQLCARPAASLQCQALSGVMGLLSRSGQSIPARLQQLQLIERSGGGLLTRAKWLINGTTLSLRALLPVLVVSSAKFPGAMARDEELAAWLTQSMAFSSRFDLDDNPASVEFEKVVVQYHTEEAKLHLPGTGGTKRVTVLTHGSLGQECLKLGTNAIPLVLAVVAIMCTYVVIMLGAETRLPGETQLLTMIFATGIPALSTFAAFGLAGYMGWRLNVMAVMAPFLGIATGIDATFLVVTAVKAVGEHEVDITKTMGKALARAGPAVTTTTVTSVASFAVASLTSSHLPGFQVFASCQALLLSLNWFGMLVLLPVLIVLNERRIAQNRHDLVPCLRRKTSQVTTEGTDQVCRTKQPLIARLDLGQRGKTIVASYIAPAVAQKTACQLVGALLWISLVVVSACLAPSLGQGMPDRYFITDNSQVMLYMDDLERYFPQGFPIELGILFLDPHLESQSYRTGLQHFQRALSAHPSAITGQPDCWPMMIANRLSSTVSDNEAQAAVREFMLEPSSKKYEWDIQLASRFSGSLATSIHAARCRLLLWQPSDPRLRSEQSKGLRELAANASIPTIVYHSSLPIQVARYNVIKQELLTSTGYCACAVFVALIICLPVHLAMLAQLNIMAVVAVLFGLMVITDITCNAMTLAICIMAIGFCVDYSCHVVHFTEHVPHDMLWNLRILHSLKECGFDVIQGCFTAFLGVSLLYFAGAEAFRMFAILSMGITSVGGLWAVWGMPAMISLASSMTQKPVHTEVTV